MRGLDRLSTVSLQTLREDIRAGRQVLDAKRQLGLLDICIDLLTHAREAERQRARAMQPDLLGSDPLTPSPVRLPGDATG